MHSRGVSGVWFPGKDWYNALPFIWENGGEVAVEMDGKWDAQFSSPESQAGIKQVQEIMTKGSTAPKDGDERDAWVPLRTEKAATLSAPSWAYWSIIADEDKKDTALTTTLGYFNLPGKDGGVASVFAGGSNIGISAKSANPELAQKALEIIMSEEYQTILARVASSRPHLPERQGRGGDARADHAARRRHRGADDEAGRRDAHRRLRRPAARLVDAGADRDHRVGLDLRHVLRPREPPAHPRHRRQLDGDLRVFAQIYALQTIGGVRETTNTIGVYIYNESMASGKLGTGGAISVILVAIMLAISAYYIRLTLKQEDDQ